MSLATLDLIHANNETIEVKMKLLDKLLERNIITQTEYDNELRKLADKAEIEYYKPEPEKPVRKGFFNK